MENPRNEMLNNALFANKICICKIIVLYLPHLFDFGLTKSLVEVGSILRQPLFCQKIWRFHKKVLPLQPLYQSFIHQNRPERLSKHHLLKESKLKEMKNLNDMTDEQLALSYIDGNNRAFDLLLSRNQSKLYSYILFVVRDRNKADDVFQETFVKVITRLQAGQYVASGKFSAWIMRIAHNVIMDSYREQQNGRIVEPTEDNDLSNLCGDDVYESNIEYQYVNRQVMEDVRRIMENLPEPQREVVYMRYYQQMSFKEISQVTNVSINTALGRMRYAIQNMRRLAKQHQVELSVFQ